MEITTVDQYIAQFPEDIQERLRTLRAAAKAAAPEAEERISWGMPSYYIGKPVIQFAAFKNHIGIYPGPAAIEFLGDKLEGYKTSKGAVQLPHSEDLPMDLVNEIMEYNLEHRVS